MDSRNPKVVRNRYAEADAKKTIKMEKPSLATIDSPIDMKRVGVPTPQTSLPVSEPTFAQMYPDAPTNQFLSSLRSSGRQKPESSAPPQSAPPQSAPSFMFPSAAERRLGILKAGAKYQTAGAGDIMNIIGGVGDTMRESRERQATVAAIDAARGLLKETNPRMLAEIDKEAMNPENKETVLEDTGMILGITLSMSDNPRMKELGEQVLKVPSIQEALQKNKGEILKASQQMQGRAAFTPEQKIEEQKIAAGLMAKAGAPRRIPFGVMANRMAVTKGFADFEEAASAGKGQEIEDEIQKQLKEIRGEGAAASAQGRLDVELSPENVAKEMDQYKQRLKTKMDMDFSPRAIEGGIVKKTAEKMTTARTYANTALTTIKNFRKPISDTLSDNAVIASTTQPFYLWYKKKMGEPGAVDVDAMITQLATLAKSGGDVGNLSWQEQELYRRLVDATNMTKAQFNTTMDELVKLLEGRLREYNLPFEEFQRKYGGGIPTMNRTPLADKEEVESGVDSMSDDELLKQLGK